MSPAIIRRLRRPNAPLQPRQLTMTPAADGCKRLLGGEITFVEVSPTLAVGQADASAGRKQSADGEMSPPRCAIGVDGTLIPKCHPRSSAECAIPTPNVLPEAPLRPTAPASLSMAALTAAAPRLAARAGCLVARKHNHLHLSLDFDNSNCAVSRFKDQRSPALRPGVWCY